MFVKSAITAAAMLVGGAMVSAPETADAQFGFYYGNSRGHNHYGHNHGWRGNYGQGWGNYGHRYHDTSHYDWHPTEIRRHGNHYHVQPGHYDYHRQGHWHHYGH